MNFLEMTPAEVRRALEEMHQPAYRAKQLGQWVWDKGVTDPAAMSNLPKAITDNVTVLTSGIIDSRTGSDGTVKLLIGLADGLSIECVLIPSSRRATACVSTQVGCAMGCVFCASGLDGVKRNLTGGEILEQVLHLQNASGIKVTNVVFMGMGEPLANYDATLAAIRAMIDPQRLNISARRITVSTIGLPDAIRRLADEDLPVTLAISLHAPNDSLRARLIPASANTPIEEIISAAAEFYQARHREVTIEYMLLKDVNDSGLCAEGLARVARNLRCNVNLIRYNPVESLPYRAPSHRDVQRFAELLQRRGVNANVRRSRGGDILAACGQLRRSAQQARDIAGQDNSDHEHAK